MDRREASLFERSMKNNFSKRPGAWEQRCLEQLDDKRIWASLKRDVPRQQEPLPADVVQLIFRYNLMIFLVVLGSLAIGFAVALGTEARELLQLQTLLPGMLGVALVAVALSAYITGIYRRSWNRRVHQITREAQGNE